MEHNVRYPKLNVKKRNTSFFAANQLNGNGIHVGEQLLKGEENFKIDRFMNDIRKFGRSSTADEVDCDANCRGNGTKQNQFKDKGEKRKKNLSSKEKVAATSKVGLNPGKHNSARCEGLFLRSIITKDFNKGLMPPSFSARLNDDLKKMIQSINGQNSDLNKNYGKKRRRGDDDVWKKITRISNRKDESFSDSSDKEDDVPEPTNITMLDEDNDPLNNENDQPVEYPQKVEAEVQVSNLLQSNSNARDDLHLKFTHFVTRSLFNSGINKSAVRKHADSIKESLLNIYHSRSKEKDEETDSFVPEFSSSEFINQQDDSDSNQISPTTQVLRESVNPPCPLTTKSDQGQPRKKFAFANDSQLSDDIIIRKPKIFSSGVEYLKAVYGNNKTEDSEDTNTARSSSYKSDFSVPQKLDDICEVRSSNSSSSFNTCHLSSSNCFNCCACEQYNHNPPLKKYSFDNNIEISNTVDENKQSCNLQNCNYFNGHRRVYSSLNDNHDTIYKPSYNKRKETSIISNPYCDSSNYISLLPTNHNLRRECCDTHSYREAVPNDGSGDSLSGYDSMFCLPLRLPPRKSPEICYVPRRMF